MARYQNYGNLDDTQNSDVDFGFKGFNNRLRPDQLDRGVLAESLNGRCDLNMEWQTRKGTGFKTTSFDAAILALDFYLYDSISSVANYTRSSEVLTINFSSAHGIVNSADSIINLSGLSVGSGINPNGNRIATYVDSNTVTVSVSGLAVIPSGTLTVTGAKLDDGEANAGYGALPFYNDTATAAYVIVIGTKKAIAVNLETNLKTEIAYPSGEIVTSSVEAVEYFGKVIIFREGDTAMIWNGVLTGSPAFTLSSNGVYTQPVSLSVTAFEITNGRGKVTVSTPSAGAGGHGLSVGDVVILTDIGSSGLLRTYGQSKDSEWVVDEIGSSTIFYFYVRSGDLASISDTKWIGKISQGMGFRHMPAPPFGTVHQGRLAVPFWYDQVGSSGSPTITDRKVRDEILLSKIQDPDVYDYIFGQLKVQGDKSDFTVGLHSFNKDALLVFNRESIHAIVGSLDLQSTKTELLTNEIGCIARRTILQIGNKIMFLSDSGVYFLDFADLYNLRGNEIPLSEKIDTTISRINKDNAHKCEAAYFNNRYYLAVPLDDWTNPNQIIKSTTLNALLVYNFLNKEWESVDTIEDTNFDYGNLFTAGDGESRGIYCCSNIGVVHQLESRDDDNDSIINTVGGSQLVKTVKGTATTRMYTLKSIDRNKWKRFEIHVESSPYNESNATFSAIVENIDGTLALGTISTLNGGLLSQGQDVSLRARIGNPRSYGFQFKFATTQGRPKMRTFKVDATETFRSTTKAI